MTLISGKINLTKFKHAIITRKTKSGEEIEGIFIPIEMNDLFKSEKGNVFLDIVAFDSVNKQYKQTHAVKQSLPKEKYEAMSEEERKQTPFLGHLNTDTGREEAAPSTQMEDSFEDLGESGNEDLPF